jgi:hypothetical protein
MCEFAFMSCAGFSVTTPHRSGGASELKALMVKTAQRVVALVDSSKFDRVALSSFAKLSDIHHLFTDGAARQDLVDQVRAAGIPVTVCGDQTTTTYTPDQQTRYRIGFANLTEDIPFGRDVRRGLELAARRHQELELLVADNRLSGELALTLADHFIAQNVDLMIEFQIDEWWAASSSKVLAEPHPADCVDPIVGATFFGDNYKTVISRG